MRILKYLLSYLPTPLPVGMTEFNKFVDDVIELSGPYADRDSMMFAIANIVMHMSPERDRVSKQTFVRRLRKAAANQVAAQAFQDIKLRQQEAQKAAEVATPTTPVDTAQPEVTSNVAESQKV